MSLDNVESEAHRHLGEGRPEAAASRYEEEAARRGYQGVIAKKYLLRAASLHAATGRSAKAAALYRLAGRTAKAHRQEGHPVFDASEAAWFLEDIADLARAYRSFKGSRPELDLARQRYASCQTPEALLNVALDRLADPEVALLSSLQAWTALSERHRDDSALHSIERFFRKHGLGWMAAALWAVLGKHDEFERVCREEDELEVAALWYEQLGLADRAARIYERMAGSREARDQVGAGLVAGNQSESRQSAGQEGDPPRNCSCGQALQPHWIKCPKCKGPLRAVCGCGEPLEAEWNECPVCERRVR